jgi:glycosyltransferase involved in cell wall biosynthesis
MAKRPDFSVVTPSYNMLGYLRRCHASVMDQQGVGVEHIVIDALSSDGTQEWLDRQADTVSVVGEDRGMYDAINKGMRVANGEIVAYLNCDEQYLPNALQTVGAFMRAHPHIDLVFGDALVVDPDGTLLAFRKGCRPRWPMILASHLYLLSCAMFVRRRVIDAGFVFESGLRDVGDMDFVVRAIRHGWRAVHFPQYLAAFTWTGNNMSTGANAVREHAITVAKAPVWVRTLSGPLNVTRYVTKLSTGAYSQRFPLDYELYSDDDLETRRRYRSHGASWRWPRVTRGRPSVPGAPELASVGSDSQPPPE